MSVWDDVTELVNLDMVFPWGRMNNMQCTLPPHCLSGFHVLYARIGVRICRGSNTFVMRGKRLTNYTDSHLVISITTNEQDFEEIICCFTPCALSAKVCIIFVYADTNVHRRV